MLFIHRPGPRDSCNPRTVILPLRMKKTGSIDNQQFHVVRAKVLPRGLSRRRVTFHQTSVRPFNLFSFRFFAQYLNLPVTVNIPRYLFRCANVVCYWQTVARENNALKLKWWSKGNGSNTKARQRKKGKTTDNDLDVIKGSTARTNAAGLRDKILTLNDWSDLQSPSLAILATRGHFTSRPRDKWPLLPPQLF